MGPAPWDQPRGWDNDSSELEDRPWQHQLLAPGEQCVGEQLTGAHIGTGPIRSYPLGLISYPSWEYSTGATQVDRGFSGLLIVRMRDARTGQKHVFIDENAGGPVVGTDTVDGVAVEQHAEAVFDLSDPSIKPDSTGAKTFNISERHQLPVSGCFQWQYDGTYKGRPYVWSWYCSG